ncbi:MAG: transcriptional regulator [Acidobacteria bacterium]|nr:MAG: transcriptional regulator [Acidobacteriota bacterium]
MNTKFRQLRLSQLDRTLQDMRASPTRPTSGWISSVREALGITLDQIGKQIGSSRQAVQQLERAEATDRITLGALRRAAEAMGCELVYALVPKSGTFVELAERPVRDRAARDVKSVMHTMMLEDQKPENADQLIEDEAQRRLNRNKTR